MPVPSPVLVGLLHRRKATRVCQQAAGRLQISAAGTCWGLLASLPPLLCCVLLLLQHRASRLCVQRQRQRQRMDWPVAAAKPDVRQPAAAAASQRDDQHAVQDTRGA